jgi:hypothetical protein
MRPKADLGLMIERIDTHTGNGILCDIIVTQVKAANMCRHGRSQLSGHTGKIGGI